MDKNLKIKFKETQYTVYLIIEKINYLEFENKSNLFNISFTKLIKIKLISLS